MAWDGRWRDGWLRPYADADGLVKAHLLAWFENQQQNHGVTGASLSSGQTRLMPPTL